MIRGKRTVALAIAMLTITSSIVAFANEPIVNSINVTESVQKELNQVRDTSAVGMINAVAQTEPEDGMKLPMIQFAKDQSIKRPTQYGGTWFASGVDSGNTIEGDLYVKYGYIYAPEPENHVTHTYGSRNQSEYDATFKHVKTAINSINFRYEPEWVYMQHHLNGQSNNSFVDPILKQKGITTTYGQWKQSNSQLISYLNSWKITKADAEKLAMYNSVVANVERKTPAFTKVASDSDICSAYSRVFKGVADADSIGQFRLLIGDIIGMNGMLAGSGTATVGMNVQVGNYWWSDGKTVLNKSNTTSPLLKKEYPGIHMNCVYEAPTFDMRSDWGLGK